MGFTTWSFGPNPEDKTETYNFIANNSDIYIEHPDDKIPWQAWINNTELPVEFTDMINGTVSDKISNIDLCVSLGLLNMDRSDLAEDFDGTIPQYNSMDDKKIEDAYFKHVDYILGKLNPKYLVICIEANELKLHSKVKWEQYKNLIKNVKLRVKEKYPDLKISESITLHNIYNPETENPEAYTNEMINYMNNMDFASISFKGMQTKNDFQKAFDLINSRINVPIAFVETCHLAENLNIKSLDLHIKSSEKKQNKYMETLLTNAQEHNYEFIIWWSYRDFDALWETFPEEVKDLGKIWRNTGILDKNGKKRASKYTWDIVFKK
ncbi:MAG: hypothetical protein GXO80_07975 [Chlorobi bacterium]|nr:hypothetical protein [Chlorobiota bacterium]